MLLYLMEEVLEMLGHNVVVLLLLLFDIPKAI
jgi:hypothetical protein